MAGSKPNLHPFSNDIINNWPKHAFIYFVFFLYILSFSTNHVHSHALTRSLLPDTAPLLAGLFSTPMGLSWYHASIVPLPTGLFSTLTCLLAFIELPCFKFLLSIDPLLVSLFSIPMGFPCIMILSIWNPIVTRVC